MGLDLVRNWMVENGTEAMLGDELSISGITNYQPLEGLMQLKVVRCFEFVFAMYFPCLFYSYCGV